MKGLAIASFIIGVLVAPIHAQAQQSLPGAPQSFSNLVWDPPTQAYAAAPKAKQPATVHHVGRHYRSLRTIARYSRTDRVVGRPSRCVYECDAAALSTRPRRFSADADA